MNVGSLFTGCGGLDLGLHAAGHRTLWACENDPACRRTLARRFPGLDILPDVRELDAGLPAVDLLAGGFPCQDLSYAGRGAGLDGDRSGLWHAYARAIRLLRPRLVIVENVPGLATRGLGRVLYDLAESGMVGSWIRLRASDLGAPHRRERIFIIARSATDPRSERLDRGRGADEERAPGDRQDRRASPERSDPSAPYPNRESSRQQERGVASEGRRSGDPGDSTSPTWGAYEPAIRRWERELGRAAPRPTDDRGRLEPSFVEWMLGFPDAWTEGESRAHRLRMLGNAVQVQVAEEIGRRAIGPAEETLLSPGRPSR